MAFMRKSTDMQEVFNHEEVKPKRKKTGGRVKGSPFRKSQNPPPMSEVIEKRKYTRSGKYSKTEKPGKRCQKKSPLNAEHSSFTFLFFIHNEDEFTELCETDKAQARAQEIFADPDYKDLKQIYFMKPLRLYNRPVMEITEL